MKEEMKRFRISTPVSVPASQLSRHSGKKTIFPSYKMFLRRFFPRANEQTAVPNYSKTCQFVPPDRPFLDAAGVI